MIGFFAAIGAGFGIGHLGLALLGQQHKGNLAVMADAPAMPLRRPPPETQALSWPDLFGSYEPQPPSPPPEPAVEPEPQPPQSSPDYVLKGLFSSDEFSWAIVSDPVGEYLLRIGDELPGGALVRQITEEGVWLETGQGLVLIRFED